MPDQIKPQGMESTEIRSGNFKWREKVANPQIRNVQIPTTNVRGKNRDNAPIKYLIGSTSENRGMIIENK